MQTRFAETALADPEIRAADGILRACVHCGFCNATCPTYQLLGDELDGPRGRIYLMKEMLESGKPPSKAVVGHIDRCLSCLSCMSTCPSGVHYMHLVDYARTRIVETYRRPWPDRALRALLAFILPSPTRFRLALLGAAIARPLAGFLPAKLAPLLRLAPTHVPAPSPVDRPQVFPAEGTRRKRVALLTGCAQQVIAPQINEATIRLLTRFGCDVVVAPGAGCCGALVHHLGEAHAAEAAARANVAAWTAAGPFDAVVINASGCGTMVKDYGHILKEPDAAAIAGLARDVCELLDGLDYAPRGAVPDLGVAYHSACSLQHGQKIHCGPAELLRRAGFRVLDVPDGHLCCGSAGTYNLLQPEIAGQLQARKVAAIESLRPDLVATGNIGCQTQIGAGTALPVVHTVELLDWASGGPRPGALGVG
jgi:glycolate oxidase iron-sulfur subunit